MVYKNHNSDAFLVAADRGVFAARVPDQVQLAWVIIGQAQVVFHEV